MNSVTFFCVFGVVDDSFMDEDHVVFCAPEMGEG